jgi:hypothetical protein
MKSFKQFDIKITSQPFVGDKIKISKILNREIVVHHFKIDDSKCFKGGSAKCLKLQITFNEESRIVFTGACGLLEMIQQVPEDGFPFTTTIVEENERFKFT